MTLSQFGVSRFQPYKELLGGIQWHWVALLAGAGMPNSSDIKALVSRPGRVVPLSKIGPIFVHQDAHDGLCGRLTGCFGQNDLGRFLPGGIR